MTEWKVGDVFRLKKGYNNPPLDKEFTISVIGSGGRINTRDWPGYANCDVCIPEYMIEPKKVEQYEGDNWI